MSYFSFINNLQLRAFASLKTIVWAMFSPFSIQISWSVVSHIVAMLIGAINGLSGGLHTYFLMRVLSDGTSKLIIHIINFEVIPESSLIKTDICRPPDSALMALTSIPRMRDTTLQLRIENGQNIAWNNCIQGKQLTLVGGDWYYGKSANNVHSSWLFLIQRFVCLQDNNTSELNSIFAKVDDRRRVSIESDYFCFNVDIFSLLCS